MAFAVPGISCIRPLAPTGLLAAGVELALLARQRMHESRIDAIGEQALERRQHADGQGIVADRESRG